VTHDLHMLALSAAVPPIYPATGGPELTARIKTLIADCPLHEE